MRSRIEVPAWVCSPRSSLNGTRGVLLERKSGASEFPVSEILSLRTVVNDGGYLRLGSSPFRDTYQHRMVMAALVYESHGIYDQTGDQWRRIVSAPGADWAGFEVDHLDRNKRHNCPENLLLIDKRIHAKLSSSSGDGVVYKRRKPVRK